MCVSTLLLSVFVHVVILSPVPCPALVCLLCRVLAAATSRWLRRTASLASRGRQLGRSGGLRRRRVYETRPEHPSGRRHTHRVDRVRQRGGGRLHGFNRRVREVFDSAISLRVGAYSRACTRGQAHARVPRPPRKRARSYPPPVFAACLFISRCVCVCSSPSSKRCRELFFWFLPSRLERAGRL